MHLSGEGVDMGKLRLCGGGAYGKSLYFLLNFSVHLKKLKTLKML